MLFIPPAHLSTLYISLYSESRSLVSLFTLPIFLHVPHPHGINCGHHDYRNGDPEAEGCFFHGRLTKAPPMSRRYVVLWTTESKTTKVPTKLSTDHDNVYEYVECRHGSWIVDSFSFISAMCVAKGLKYPKECKREVNGKSRYKDRDVEGKTGVATDSYGLT
ncbi:hypothetical protein KQX54_015174 [Cotesia glomerata]|uniref:Uncharacterized protein n=1 Tax=Cotesia glomerata TaxID=32391 RepID=A0AAV7HWU0_COTGL|nr:hypothetical protein KQX54_015174 [Cotesia glomerata]